MPEHLQKLVIFELDEGIQEVRAASSGASEAAPEPSSPEAEAATASGTAPEPTEAAAGLQSDEEEVPANLCPVCGEPCVPLGFRTRRSPKWKCSNAECSGGPEGGPWMSWHDDPWKPGGEVETLDSRARPLNARAVVETRDPTQEEHPTRGELLERDADEEGSPA